MKSPLPLFATLALVGFGSLAPLASSRAAEPASVTAAVAVLHHSAGSKVAGVIRFTQTDAGVSVVADVTGLAPGKHGFHIHEFGDVSDTAKAMSTGGHYDPTGSHHHDLIDADHPGAENHHAGDMGNLVADETGKAHLEATLAGLTLLGAANAIVGRAVIVHEKADDGGQPTGNAGGRVASGVIGIAKAP